MDFVDSNGSNASAGRPADRQRQLRSIHLWFLGLILLAGLSVRIYRLDTLPDGFFCDEASLGYNAWAILHFGIDETGAHLPLYATSLGVRKNPVFVYASMIPIGVFGLSEWSVRLTSAVFGTLTILAVFWLMFEIHGTLAGLIAALLTAVLPWNFHFSRIAFELITWPCLFTAGLAATFRGLRKGGSIWLVAGGCFGLALHSYVMALAFLPLFLPILVIVYARSIARHMRWFAAGLLVFSLLTVPAVTHHLETRSNFHYEAVSWWHQDSEQPLTERLEILWDHYHPFFNRTFLVDIGDPNPRHTLHNHGPIYESLFYLSIAGMVVSLLPPRRCLWILAAWTILYPLGTAMTIDRYATRSIIGSPLAPVWSSLAIVWVTALLARIRWKIPRTAACTLAVIIPLGWIAKDTATYFRRYFTEYNIQAAAGIYGFQYGYKQLIEFMEPLRSQYDQFLWTALDVNEPYIFPLFYNRIDPNDYLEDYDIGYEIVRSFEFEKYSMEPRTLFAVRPVELMYFDDYTVLKEIKEFHGNTEFVIIEPRTRRPYFDDWAVRGLTRNNRPDRCGAEYPDPSNGFLDPVESLSGLSHFIPVCKRPPLVDLQRTFIQADPKYPRNPEYVTCIGATWMFFDTPIDGSVEVFGSHDHFALWLNGEIVIEPRQLKSRHITRKKFYCAAGWNEWSFRACEGVGDWFFIVTYRDSENRELIPRYIRTAPPGLDDHPLSPDVMDFIEANIL